MDYLFLYSDIIVSVLICLISFYTVFRAKTYEDAFLFFFVTSLLVALTILLVVDEQIQLGEFLLINSVFLFSVLFFCYHTSRKGYLNLSSVKLKKARSTLYSLFFIFLILSTVLNFTILEYRKPSISKSKKVAVVTNEVQNDRETDNMFYNKKIKSLSENKLFGKMTEIIIVYSGVMMTFLFFSKKRKES